MRSWKWLAAVTALALVSGSAAAGEPDDYPNRPVRLIVAFAAGATNDVVARLLGKEMSTVLGQPIVVENKPGASGLIAAQAVKNSPADGYTLFQGNTSILGINPSLFKSLPYDPVNDFEPISVVAASPSVLVVSPSLNVKTVAELVAYAKANPDKLLYGSPGSGTPMHLSAELFKVQTGATMTHIPYKGSSQVITDLLAGHVQVMFDNIPSILPQIRAGKAIALVTTGAQRLPVLPDVPTVREAGFSGAESNSWFGLVAPKGTPKPIVDKLAAAIRKSVQSPEFRERLGQMGAEPVGGTPADMAAHIKAEMAKWAPVVEASGARL